MPHPADLTATQAAAQLRDGRLRPEALMEACLNRAAQREPTVQAMAWLDPAAAREAASCAGSGPLHGLPIGIKDVLDTADMPSEYNSAIWRGHRPRDDAACVAWARAAGGVAFGKTVTTEFATRHPGPTTNPHDPARTPGGSSSGSAAGVAAGFFPLAFGTQTAGSVIRPAAYCGIVGYKPTFGLIPREGMKLMSDSLDTVGVMARSVADCALFAGAVAGADLGDPDARPSNTPRIGLCRTPLWSRAAPETHALFEQAASRLGSKGATVRNVELPGAYSTVEDAHAVVMNAESARALGWEMTRHRDALSQVLRERLEWGLAQPAAAVAEARATLRDLRAGFAGVMDGLDVLVTPAAPGEAPAGLAWTGDAGFNFIWTSLHVPCVTVPAGTGPNGMPLGIQIVGRYGEDRAALAWAAWVAGALA